MGPVVLFDKSFLEMLSVDEAVIFDFMFSSNICPIFYIETLADLEKDDPGRRTREKIVADLANKTPSVHSYPNVIHSSICLAELLGSPIDQRRFPIIAGGQPVRSDGKIGVYYQQSPESQAFIRWQDRQFLELERGFAARWRAELLSADLTNIAALTRDMLAIRLQPRNEQQAYDMAQEVIFGKRNRYRIFQTAYYLLRLPSQHWSTILRLWKAAGGPPLPEYAPYTAHCLLVDTFFHLAIAKGLISPERTSNRIDMAYLYYLPFAMIFVSNDKLHRRTAPLFLGKGQEFVGGAELKADLQALVEHFSALPPELLEQGLFKATHSQPPDDGKYLTTRLWRRFGVTIEPTPPLAPETHDRVYSRVRAMVDGMEKEVRAPTSNVAWDEAADPEQVTLARKIPRRLGRWNLLPPRST